MQYLVQTNGKVLNSCTKTYIINATSKENANEMAKNKFAEEFYIVEDEIVIKSDRRTQRAVASMLFMIIPVLLSFISWKDGHNTVSIKPDYISCLFSVLLYLAYVVRFKGIQRTVGSWIDISFCFIVILLLSSFLQVLLVEKNFCFFGINTKINTTLILAIAIILSVLGVKLVSAICISLVCLCAVVNMMTLNVAMGSVWGPVYILCATMGIMLYVSVEPGVIEALPYMKHSIALGYNYLQSDYVEVKKAASYVKNRVVDYGNKSKSDEKG